MLPVDCQIAVLAQRQVRTWLRNPVMLSSEVLQYVLVALFVGTLHACHPCNSFTTLHFLACLVFPIFLFCPSFLL